MTRKFFLIALLCVVVLVGALAVSFVAGVASAHYRTEPYRVAIEKLREMRQPTTETGLVRNKLWSVFVPLEYTEDRIDGIREGTGGGLTPFRDGVLLITHDGQFFYSDGPGRVDRLDLNAPENGYADIERASTELGPNFQFDLTQYRYDDVLYLDRATGDELFVSHIRYYADDQCYRNVVSRASLSDIDLAALGETETRLDWSDLFASEPCLPLTEGPSAVDGRNSGGRMTVRGDNLYFGNGDFGWDGMARPLAVSQMADNDYGKAIEISLVTGQARRFTTGQRNIQGIAVDREGDIYSVEHAVLGGDELNLVERGRNYGWPFESLGTGYNGLQLATTTSYGRHDRFERPIYAWLPSVAISSLNIIEDFHDAWDGDLLLATLKGQSLRRIRIRDQRVIFEEPIFVGERIRYAQPISGNIVLWTDSKKLLWVFEAETDRRAEFVDAAIEKLDGDSSFKSRVRAAMENCQRCHSLEPGRNDGAPSLANIYNKDIASTGFAAYSPALSSMSGNWDRENLRDMILDPEAVVPGTNMPNPGVTDVDVADGVVAILARLLSIE